MLKDLTIGKVAKESGVGVETVRFYEREGLIRQPKRRDHGFRTYDKDDPTKIRFIKRAQEIGFTLKEIKGLLDLQATSKSMCGDVKKRADEKIIEVQGKISDLKKMLRSLKEISNCCARGKTTNDVCSVTDCFGGKC